jgi:hypothetical protein
MYRRRLSIMLVLAVVAFLGLLLFLSVRPSGMFRIATPSAPAISPQTDLSQIKSSVSSTSLNNVSATTLLQKPRYTGQDALGRNWLLSAESAGQEGTATSGTYILQQVQAVFDDPSQTTPFTLSAEQGRYTQTSSTIKLTGTVSATGIGFNLTAPEVDADLTTRKLQASGGSRVTGQIQGKSAGAKGWDVNITAPNLNADQNSSRLVLTGGVHATFTPTGQ